MISIIIPAYNEEKYIDTTLKSIKEQDFKDYEIIVVCNGCTDKTFFISKKYTSKVFNLKEKNVSKAKNFGAEKAKNNFLIFLDADVVLLDKNVLSSVFEILNKGNYFGTVKGKGFGIRNGNYLRFKNLINKFKPWSQGFVYCSKGSFFDASGFNEKLLKGELRNFFKKVNCKYKRINVYVSPNDRRIKNWGIFKLINYWIYPKENYDAVR